MPKKSSSDHRAAAVGSSRCEEKTLNAADGEDDKAAKKQNPTRKDLPIVLRNDAGCEAAPEWRPASTSLWAARAQWRELPRHRHAGQAPSTSWFRYARKLQRPTTLRIATTIATTSHLGDRHPPWTDGHADDRLRSRPCHPPRSDAQISDAQCNSLALRDRKAEYIKGSATSCFL